MSTPNMLNSQIVQAVAQTNVKVVGEAPAEGIAAAIQGAAHSTMLAMENATQAQGGMQQIANATVATLITQITQITTAAAAAPAPAKPGG
jgi:hypothetical protein